MYVDSDSDDDLFVPPPNRARMGPGIRRGIPQPGFVEDESRYAAASPSSSTTAAEPPPPDDPRHPNLNRRYDYLPESMVPAWYIKNPVYVPEGDRKHLCATCRRINIIALFRQPETDVMPKPRDYIALGSFGSILEREGCGFCRLVARIIVLDTGTDLPRAMPHAERLAIQTERVNALTDEVYHLCPVRFETTFNVPALYICSGRDVNEAAKQSAAVRPRRSMAVRPLHRSEPNTGRILLAPDRIDFDWVRERMRLCDERDVGKLAYRHGVAVRAIDVRRMCIVDLDHGVRYVTLSYTWGKVAQLLLTRDAEARFRADGYLDARLAAIPKTIRDAIKLVREIGERFLWVDALCIFQDDRADMDAQIAEMGEIYRNSILTVCACCGDDADYGLPGIEPGTRVTRQAAEIVGDFVLGNALPDSEPDAATGEAGGGGTWDTRGWTLQEKVLSQRKLQVYDSCVRWWCWHTITPEDENCRHVGWEPGTRHRGMYFFKTEHDLVVSKIRRNANMDIYAFIVSDYTARNLTHQADAERAVTGVLSAIDGLFRGAFVAGLPDTELAAALLWCPIGAHRRRADPTTGAALFPSWSWLGWVGHVAYPWLIERTLPMAEHGSPLEWRNALAGAAGGDDEWFTGDEYRMGGVPPNFLERRRGQPDRWAADEDDPWTFVDAHSESHRWLNPVVEGGARPYRFFGGGRAGDGNAPPLALRFRTLSAGLRLDARVRVRKENHDYLHRVHLVRVLDGRGFAAGYIYVPDPETLSAEEAAAFTGGSAREFVVLSRASGNADPSMGRELLHETPIAELHSVYSMSYMMGALGRLRPSDGEGDEAGGGGGDVDEAAHFDTRLYDGATPWGLFNVMMIERVGGVAYRVAVGRIHVAAFMDAEPTYEEITLG